MQENVPNAVNSLPELFRHVMIAFISNIHDLLPCSNL